MKILSLKPGHDGHVCLLEDGHLIFSMEAEKDSGRRFAELSAEQFLEAGRLVHSAPDVIALSGWSRGGDALGRPIGNGYRGLAPPEISNSAFMGRETLIASSSHERAHILCSYGLSPFPQGTSCYALVWEGHIGSFYSIDRDLNIEQLEEVMLCPGDRYAFAYALADPAFPNIEGKIRLADAGKVMALAGFNSSAQASAEEARLIRSLMQHPGRCPPLRKLDFTDHAIYNCGPESETAKRACRLVSDAIYSHFISALERCTREPRPLLIAGGCGLNCEWNTRLRGSGLFSQVYVPPCTNDVGAAIGTAVDAQWRLTGQAKIEWQAYAGLGFHDDLGYKTADRLGTFVNRGYGAEIIAAAIAEEKILGWVAGRAEIGPRALGARSILASATTAGIRDRLNRIKQREGFRPIAPVCLEHEAFVHFDCEAPSPHMLYFANVRSPALSEVTHVDGTARLQTLNEMQHQRLYELLLASRSRSGFGVLCNTSLNFKGSGFINRTSDLLRYGEERGLDGFVIEGRYFERVGPLE